jgi:hypothetical protein
MQLLVRIFVHLVDWAFGAGMIGSVAVLVITGIEDLRTLLGN